jgi:diaminopropionate ammonia-lyase
MFEFAPLSEFAPNPRAVKNSVSQALATSFGKDALNRVRHLLTLCPLHQTTPLLRLNALADALDLGCVFAKDESSRLGLGSFKALGGAYAVAELILGWATDHLQKDVAPHELASTAVKAVASARTVCCATDGNHGRSVAAGARLFGCKAVIFVHQHVAEEQRAALRALKARVIEVPGTYDDSVDECARMAYANNWQVVSDTNWNSDSPIPTQVMQGYTVLIDEVLNQMVDPPTHVFVQGGVGGLAGAIAAHLANCYGAARPTLVVVEPDRAACLMASVLAGAATEITAGQSTVMAMLECYRPSQTAWPILDLYADAFMTLPEKAAPEILAFLARPMGKDPAIIAGLSGGIGLAGLIAAAQDPKVRGSLSLDQNSRVLTIITEGTAALASGRETSQISKFQLQPTTGVTL